MLTFDFDCGAGDKGLVDVSNLGGVNPLSLQYRKNIKDGSALASAPNLRPANIKDAKNERACLDTMQ